MSRGTITPSLIAHGGAGGRAPAADRVARRRGMLDAVGRGAEILRGGGSALDAVVATVVALENDPLFNAGYGSVLTTAGRVEMDAAVMTATRSQSALGEHAANVNGARVASGPTGRRAARTVAVQIRAGGVVLVSRVRNPIELARAVMERTPHLLMGGAGAERIARQAALALCRPQDLVSPRARERWLAARELIGRPSPSDQFAADAHGTVGAVAIDARGDYRRGDLHRRRLRQASRPYRRFRDYRSGISLPMGSEAPRLPARAKRSCASRSAARRSWH